MPEKSLLIAVLGGFLLFSFLLTFFQGFHGHWISRTERAARARLYLKSEVCTNARLRIQLGPEAMCAQKEHELRVQPFNRAIFDTLEDYSLCGHRRCEAMAQWAIAYKWLFLGAAAVLLYFYMQCFFFSYQVNKMQSWQQQLTLPGGGQHIHLD